MCIDTPYTRLDVIKLMSCICLDNQEKGLEAMRESSRDDVKSPFYKIIEMLTCAEYTVELKAVCLQLINTIIQSKSNGFRFHVRQELIGSGFNRALPLLRSLNNEKIKTQLMAFDKAKDCKLIDVGYCKLEFNEAW